MYFNFKLGLQEIQDNARINIREAVRGIAVNADNEILMIKTSKGDYKFPGGGIESGEEHFTALYREFQEEAGCLIADSIMLIGIVVEQSEDIYDSGAY